MTAGEPPRPEQEVIEDLADLNDELADYVEHLRLMAENHREAAADYLRAAERAERRARWFSAYRYANEVFVGDPQALDLVDRLIEDWTGDGEQLVIVVRQVLRTSDDPTGR